MESEVRDMPEGINRYQVRDMVSKGAQLVEVLPHEEYHSWHLPYAINIPINELDRRSAAQLDKDRPVIVYCADTQ
jgi:rhodanese-related sulfurtransferase